MKLTEWSLTGDFFENIQVHGYVSGHHRLVDGNWIDTGKVLFMEAEEVSGSKR